MDQTQEIKNRLDLIEVIKGYLRLEKSGINFRGLCPFHNEKTPSFFVSPSKQMWHCFGCSRGGDIFAFVQEIENIEFIDALRLLAEKAGITLRREDPKIKNQRQRLYDVLDLAAKFFEAQLDKNKQVKSYLASRGLKETTLKEFRLGFSPSSWDGLSSFLYSKGFKSQEVAQAGLTISNPNDAARYYDRFRGRIMFPIFDTNGRVVGFGGRIFESSSKEQNFEGPKYVNTPNTLIYDKSRLLFGLNKSKNSIRESNCVVLVEGYMDFLMSWQAGVKNIVASSGTALTPQQLDILKRLSDTVLTAFDTDEAGEGATKRSIDLALLKEFEVKVIRMDEDIKDPAEAVQKSPQTWQESVKKAMPVMEFYFDKVFRNYDPEKVEHKKIIAQQLLPEIKKLPNSIEQAHWLSEIAYKLKIKETVLEEELKRISKFASSENLISGIAETNEVQPVKKSRAEMLFERLVYLLAQTPEAKPILEKLEVSKTPEMPITKIFLKFKNSQALDDSEQKLLDYIIFRNEVFDKPQDSEKEIQFCVQSLQIMSLKDELNKLAWQIRKAEKDKDDKVTQELIKKFQEKSSFLNKFYNEKEKS